MIHDLARLAFSRRPARLILHLPCTCSAGSRLTGRQPLSSIREFSTAKAPRGRFVNTSSRTTSSMRLSSFRQTFFLVWRLPLVFWYSRRARRRTTFCLLTQAVSLSDTIPRTSSPRRISTALQAWFFSGVRRNADLEGKLGWTESMRWLSAFVPMAWNISHCAIFARERIMLNGTKQTGNVMTTLI